MPSPSPPVPHSYMKSYALPLTLTALAILVLAGVLLVKPTATALGGAFTGTSAYLQSAATTSVNSFTGTTTPAVTLFSAKTDGSCKSRVVSVPGTSPIVISFGDTSILSSTTLSTISGVLQAASTTVTYDGELYGCGRMTARAWATTTVTTSEF